MKIVKNIKCCDLKDEELDEFLNFIRTSLEKDATFKGMVKNVKDALHNSHLGMMTYIPTLEANVFCEGQDLLNVMDEMANEMLLVNDATNQRTKVSLGLPRGCAGVTESNIWMAELKSRADARRTAKGYSQHDIVVIGLGISGDTIDVHVAYKDEVENANGLNFLPITSKFLTRLMGYAA